MPAYNTRPPLSHKNTPPPADLTYSITPPILQAAIDVDADTGLSTLVLGSHDTGGASRLAALDPTTNTLRWATPSGKAYCVTGLAIVPGQVRVVPVCGGVGVYSAHYWV